MADQAVERELLNEVQQGAQVMARLAEESDEDFRGVVDAFRAQDGEALQQLLARHKLSKHCETICHWLRSKECVLLCLELAGPPPAEVEDIPDVREFAEVVAKVIADDALVRLVATAVQERNRDAWSELIDRNGLQRFNHLLCHWVCTVRYRLVCHVVCTPGKIPTPPLIKELQFAAKAIGKFAANDRLFTDAVEAVKAFDCVRLNGTLADSPFAPFCHIICEWFCSWRCMLVCLRLCRIFPLERIDSPISEIIDFARAGGRIAGQGAVPRLTAAILREDVETVADLVRRLEFERYCLQFCHWVCFLRCNVFCRCVCPPIDTIPLFTSVGIYRVNPMWGDFQADGTTTGGSLAFTDTIPLNGILPDAQAVQATEYRFLVTKHPPLNPGDSAAPQPVVAPLAAPTEIGQLEYLYWDTTFPVGWKPNHAVYWVNNPGATANIPQEFGPPLTPSVNVQIDPDGWIKVPREDALLEGGIGRFVHNATGLLNIDTKVLTNETFDLTVPPPGLRAGNAVPATAHSEAPTYRIAFEARVVGGAQVAANSLERIALSNTHYKYARHAEWAGSTPTTRSVCSLDIAELIGPGATGCDRLQNQLHALFTAYHPYLGSVTVSFEGNPPLPAAITPAIVGHEANSGSAGHLFDITTLNPCAYILWLTVTLRLTSGSGPISGSMEQDHIAFCKDKARIGGGARG
jgi:hypothetical protein